MMGASDLAKMVPGFEFLQGLMKNGAAGMPAIGQWVAPTLDPAELEKRINDLRTVQFWLEQNARLIATTIQALEVQRMTLSTLQTMNLPMADLRDALAIKPDAPKAALAAAPAAAAALAPAPAARKKAAAPKRHTNGDGERPAAPAAVDPMQWWGALTQQFTEIATKALKDGAAAVPGAATVAPAAVAKAGAALRARARKG
jgi:hypothetical protein